MKNLNVRRALGFSLLLYLGTAILFTILSPIFGVSIDTSPQDVSLAQCIVYWVLSIPLILVLAKWYFRKFQPSFKRGVMLGICALIISYILDAGMILLTMSDRGGWDLLKTMYMDWKFYVAVFVVLGTTTFAGFEFDRTYTFDEKGLTKKSK